jgi:hypothetical protein
MPPDSPCVLTLLVTEEDRCCQSNRGYEPKEPDANPSAEKGGTPYERRARLADLQLILEGITFNK